MKSDQRKRPRCDSYQHLFYEIPVGLLSQPSTKIENPEIKEEMFQCLEKINLMILEEAPKALSAHQLEIFVLANQGTSQTEISKRLGLNQSTIYKNLKGTKKGKENKAIYYGGIYKKLKKHLEGLPEFMEVLFYYQSLRQDLF